MSPVAALCASAVALEGDGAAGLEAAEWPPPDCVAAAVVGEELLEPQPAIAIAPTMAPTAGSGVMKRVIVMPASSAGWPEFLLNAAQARSVPASPRPWPNFYVYTT